MESMDCSFGFAALNILAIQLNGISSDIIFVFAPIQIDYEEGVCLHLTHA